LADYKSADQASQKKNVFFRNESEENTKPSGDIAQPHSEIN